MDYEVPNPRRRARAAQIDRQVPLMSAPTTWQSYEEVARFVLRELRRALNIADVGPPAVLPGESGTTWHVDGTATRAPDGAALILECKRKVGRRLDQEAIGGIAFRVLETGVGGAIVVTPLPLQKGAEMVARAQGIQHVQLEPWSTSENYLARFLGQAFYGVTLTESVHVTDCVEATVIRGGKLVK